MKIKVSITAMILMGVSTGAWATGDDDAEATIRLMDTAEAELPGAVMKTITLPKALQVNAEDQAETVDKAKGHDKANERLTNENRKKGLAQAEAARQNGRDMSENAKDVRESRSRSEDNRPARPEPPNRPENPPGRD